MAWVAVVEVIEDNLLFPHLLILVELFLCRCLAFCEMFMRHKQFHSPFSLPSLRTRVSGRLVFLMIRCVLHAPVPSVVHDISSRCGMWEVVLIFVLLLTFLCLFRDCRLYPRCSRGAFSMSKLRSQPHCPLSWGSMEECSPPC